MGSACPGGVSEHVVYCIYCITASIPESPFIDLYNTCLVEGLSILCALTDVRGLCAAVRVRLGVAQAAVPVACSEDVIGVMGVDVSDGGVPSGGSSALWAERHQEASSESDTCIWSDEKPLYGRNLHVLVLVRSFFIVSAVRARHPSSRASSGGWRARIDNAFFRKRVCS